MNRRMIAVVVGVILALMLGPFKSHARYLNPNTGRFQTMDSYEGVQADPPSLHKYLYAHANPISNTDPSGNLAEQPLFTTAKQFEMRTANLAAVNGARTFAQRSIAASLIQQTLPLLVGAGILLTPTDIGEEDDYSLRVIVFREVDGERKGTPPKYRKAKLNPGTFRLDPDGVSMFESESLPGNKPYVVAFFVRLLGPKLPGTVHPVLGIPTCTGTFTPHFGPGHWSLNCTPQVSTPTALSTYARAGRTVHVNPKWPRPEEVELPQ